MAKEQYMDLLRDILSETDYKYGRIEEDGDGYNDEVFLYESYGNEIADLNELCKAKLRKAGVDTYPDYDRDEYYVDFITGDNWGYEGEYYICDCCGKAYRQPEYGTHTYWVGDGFIFCEDCVREKYKDSYIFTYLANNPTHANTIIGVGDLENMGFEKANEYGYENGMYGTNDCPTEIYEELRKKYPNSDVVFHITDSNPFAVYFDAYILKADEDITNRYMDKDTGEVMTYEQMKEYCEENYDYGDPTNMVTYMTEWYKEYGFEKIA